LQFIGAYLLRHRVLISSAGTNPISLSGFDAEPRVELRGTVSKVRSTPALIGASGAAFFGRIQGRWYFVAAEAANALRQHTSKA
jgi:hypothetical protein